MTIVEILTDLRARDIRLRLEGDRLRFDAPAGAMTDVLRAALTSRKTELIAILIESDQSDGKSGAAIGRANREAPLALSFAQQRLWFLHRFEEDSADYHMSDAVRLHGDLDSATLARAINAVVARHESLRTRFVETATGPVQLIDAAVDGPLAVENLSELAPAARADALAALLHRERTAPFELERGGLLRMKLIRLGAQEHLLLRVCHHIIADGWSMGIFNRELSALYRAFRAGRGHPLTPLPLQYPDFAIWQRQWLQGAELARQVSYWRERLAHAPTLDLPTDRPRPERQTTAGARHAFAVPAALGIRLKEFNRQEQLTPFMSLLAAFQVLLARTSGQDDVLIGTPIANRQRIELEALIGFFANTLVLRGDLAGAPSFREVAARVRRTALDAYQHQDLPFEKLVEELNPARDLSRHPIFQVMFVLQNADVTPLALDGVEATPYRLPSHATPFDLELHLWPDGEGWAGSIYFNTDLFDPGTIARLAGHYLTLLEAMLAAPAQPVGAIDLLSAAERQRLLVEWNDTAADYPRDRCIHELFEARAAATPDAVALVAGERTLTYRQLNDRASDLAQHLHTLGAGPGALVGLCAERSAELVVGLLGVLKAGAAYLPIDPAYPVERVSLMLRDAAPALVLAQRKTAAGLAAVPDGQLVFLDELRWSEAPPSAAPPPRRTAPEDPAYVIYTSGSTGTPKGVVTPHRALVNYISAVIAGYPIAPGDRVLQFASPSFDVAAEEIFGALCGGATLVLRSEEMLASPAQFADSCGRADISVLILPTAYWHVLVAAMETDGVRPWLTLRLVVIGGERALPARLTAWQRHAGPRIKIINNYGPTELTIGATWCDVTALNVAGAREVPIGRPVANLQAYVLNAFLQPVPCGVAGELFLGGDGLALGYLRRDELTAEKFIANPFHPARSARLYRTGDRVRYRADGNLEFLSRVDDQVKVRGFRIELGEVEAALRRHPGVQAGVAVVREDEPGEKNLAAYFVPLAAGAAPTAAELREFLKRTLPDYLVPSSFTPLPALPLTPHDKVDRRALPRPAPGSIGAGRGEPAAPRNLLELKLTEAWQRLFQRDDLQRDDNFFELGGHSLLATRLAGDIEKIVGRRVPIAALFQAPTIATQARMLRREEWSPAWSSLVPLQPKGAGPAVFCVHGWGGDVYGFLDLARALSPERPVYGLQAAGLHDDEPRHLSVEEMAAHYAREIRALQPAGPYHLVGHSVGGWIAYAVAQELERAGGRMGTLALLATEAGCRLPWPLHMQQILPFLGRRLRFHLGHWLEIPRGERRRYLARIAHQLTHHLTRARPDDLPPKAQAPARPAPQGNDPAKFAQADYHATLVTRYRPARYRGDAALFMTHDTRIAPRPFWKFFVRGRVQLHWVPGNHYTLVDAEHVAGFARVFRQVLNDAESPASVRRKSGAP